LGFFRAGECPPFHVTLLLNPPPREEDLPSAVAENRVGEGNLRFLNPCHFVTSPFRGTPTSPFGRVGRPRCFNFLRKSRLRGCRGAEAPSLRSNIR
jgi:hypothetical protein